MIYFHPNKFTTIFFLLGSKFAAATATHPPIYNSEPKIDQNLLIKRKEGPGKGDNLINQEELADQITFNHVQMERFFPEPESPDMTWDIVSSVLDEAGLRNASVVSSDHDTISMHSEDLHYFDTEMDEMEEIIEERPDFRSRSSQNTDPVSIFGSSEYLMEGPNSQEQSLPE